MARVQAAGSGVESLRMTFRGQVLTEEDPAYDSARKVYNGMIDRRPAVIARCADAADVVAALAFAHESGLVTSVRGGGHNGAGLAVCDHGLVIDLSMMKGVHVDPKTERVRVEAGCTQGEVDHATHLFGLAVPSGTVSMTGIAGLTLGGGHGYLTRQWGLTIDNLIEADVILADGRMVRASESENDDLFWGIRGGGGNFGIVTSFLFQGRQVNQVVAGPMMWPVEQVGDILEWYREFMPGAPTSEYGFPAILRVPPVPLFPEAHHERPVCAIVWCLSGPIEEGLQTLQRVRRELPTPIIDMAGPMPFPTLQRLFDPLIPPGLQWYWKGDFFDRIPDETFAIHRRYGEMNPSHLCTMHLYPIDGVASKVPEDATAFSFRKAKWSAVYAGIHPDKAGADAITAWARNYWNEMHPYSLGGGYVNFMMEEGAEPVKATYGKNYNRLRTVKRKYDPDNFFCRNQNIEPADK